MLPLEVQGHTVPHWKTLRYGKDGSREFGCGSNSSICQDVLKSVNLLHKRGFVYLQMKTNVQKKSVFQEIKHNNHKYGILIMIHYPGYYILKNIGHPLSRQCFRVFSKGTESLLALDEVFNEASMTQLSPFFCPYISDYNKGFGLSQCFSALFMCVCYYAPVSVL